MSTPRRRAAGSIRVARTVLDEIKGLEPPEADAVREAIDSVGTTEGEPVDIPVAPPGTAYLALAPADPAAPVVIYRPMLPDERGDWLVTALMDRDDYEVQQEAQRNGLLRDPAVRTAVTAAATAISDAVNGRRRLRDRPTCGSRDHVTKGPVFGALRHKRMKGVAGALAMLVRDK